MPQLLPLFSDFSTPLRKCNQEALGVSQLWTTQPRAGKGRVPAGSSSGPTCSHRSEEARPDRLLPGFLCMDRPFRRRARIGKLSCPLFVKSGPRPPLPGGPSPSHHSHQAHSCRPHLKNLGLFFSYGREFPARTRNVDGREFRTKTRNIDGREFHARTRNVETSFGKRPFYFLEKAPRENRISRRRR